MNLKHFDGTTEMDEDALLNLFMKLKVALVGPVSSDTFCGTSPSFRKAGLPTLSQANELPLVCRTKLNLSSRQMDMG